MITTNWPSGIYNWAIILVLCKFDIVCHLDNDDSVHKGTEVIFCIKLVYIIITELLAGFVVTWKQHYLWRENLSLDWNSIQ